MNVKESGMGLCKNIAIVSSEKIQKIREAELNKKKVSIYELTDLNAARNNDLILKYDSYILDYIKTLKADNLEEEKIVEGRLTEIKLQKFQGIDPCE